MPVGNNQRLLGGGGGGGGGLIGLATSLVGNSGGQQLIQGFQNHRASKHADKFQRKSTKQMEKAWKKGRGMPLQMGMGMGSQAGYGQIANYNDDQQQQQRQGNGLVAPGQMQAMQFYRLHIECL